MSENLFRVVRALVNMPSGDRKASWRSLLLDALESDGPATPWQELDIMPHCDERVLHAPGECKYCDERPVWQALRKTWGIAFSNHDPVDDQVPCPSEARRPREKVNLWGGNVSKPEGSE